MTLISVYLVVGAEQELAADTDTEAVEYLCEGVHPDVEVREESIPVSGHVEVGDTSTEAVLHGQDDKEGGENDVGEESDEVGELAVALNPLHQRQSDNQIAESEAADHLPPRSPPGLPGVLRANTGLAVHPPLKELLTGSDPVSDIRQRHNNSIEGAAIRPVVFPVEILTEVRLEPASFIVEGRVWVLLQTTIIISLGVTFLSGEILQYCSQAAGPGQRRPEAHEHVVPGPGHDDGVVEGHHGGDGQDPVAEALHDRRHPAEDLGAAGARVLAQDHLHEVQGEATEQQGDQVGDEESSTTVIIANVRESEIEKSI